MKTINETRLDLLMEVIERSVDGVKEMKNNYLQDKENETLTLKKITEMNKNWIKGVETTATMLEETVDQLGHLLPAKYLARVAVYSLELQDLVSWRNEIHNDINKQIILCGIKELEEAFL